MTTVVAAAGYPHAVRTGDVIQLPPDEEGIEVFHGGTARDPLTNDLVTAGGRVLCAVGLGGAVVLAEPLDQLDLLLRHDLDRPHQDDEQEEGDAEQDDGVEINHARVTSNTMPSAATTRTLVPIGSVS